MAINQQLQERIINVQKAFADAKANEVLLAATARNAAQEPNLFHKEVTASLNQYKSYINKLEKDGSKEKRYEISENIYNFLSGIAEISPAFAQTMQGQGLKGLQLKDFINNAELLKKLKALLDSVVKADKNQQWYQDLSRALKEYYSAEDKAKTKLGKLVNSIPAHAQAAQSEIDKLSNAAIEYRANSGLYDPVKALGSFLSTLINSRFIAPLEDALYPNAKLPEQDINGNATRRLRQNMTGMDV